MTDALRPDLCVIGAGAAGLTAAAGAAQLGAEVVLIEGAEMGGDCLHTGCVPSKTMLAAGAAGASHAQALARARRAVAAIAPHDDQPRFEALGVRVIRDWARFVSDREVEAGGARIRARRFLVATGSVPAIPEVPGLDETPFLTTDTLFSLDETPRRLLILGGGAIAVEMAQAHRRLGCEVAILARGRALAVEDPDAARLLLARLEAEGVEIHEQAPLAGLRPVAEGVEAQLPDGRSFLGDRLLIAAGRRADLGRLNLAAAGLEAGPRGLRVDRHLRSANPRVFAAGDAADVAGLTGELWDCGGWGGDPGRFTHLAGWQGAQALRAMLFRLPARALPAALPRVIHTDPPLGRIGLSERDARDRFGKRLEVIQVPFAEVDRAVTDQAGRGGEDPPEGFLKLMIRAGALGPRVVGVVAVGPGAGEVVQLWSLVFASGARLSAVAGMISPYPTLGEISRKAAGEYYARRLFASPWPGRALRLLSRLG